MRVRVPQPPSTSNPLNEILALALGAAFSLVSSICSGIVFFWLRSVRADFREIARKVEMVDAKGNENREAIARLEGRFGRLGTKQNWQP